MKLYRFDRLKYNITLKDIAKILLNDPHAIGALIKISSNNEIPISFDLSHNISLY